MLWIFFVSKWSDILFIANFYISKKPMYYDENYNYFMFE